LTLDLAKNEKAAELLEELVRSHPGHPKLLRLQSLALNRLGRVDDVVTIQRRLRGQFPKDPVPARLTRAWMARGNRTAALKVARDRVRMTPTDAEAQRELSRILLAAGQAEEAWWEIRRAVDLASTDVKTYLIKTWAAIKTSRWEAAREALAQARETGGPTEEIQRIERTLRTPDQDRKPRRWRRSLKTKKTWISTRTSL